MSLKSDIWLDADKFAPSSASAETLKFNDMLVDIAESGPRWYQVGAAKYREMRWKGETAFPAPAVLEEGIKMSIPSRDKGRDIPCRMFKPAGPSKGVFMHIHGGGWTLQSEEYQDAILKFLSDVGQLTVVSVGYRLAPEDPFPAGPNDCYDAGEWLVDNSKEQYGSELLFVGGESAGGHLSCLTCFHLIRARPKFEFRGVLLHYGMFDLSGYLPQVHHYPRPLVIDYDIINKYLEAFLPDLTETQRRDPGISPFFEKLQHLANGTPSGKLPPALFTCGTEDPLLDDTVVMSAKWMMAGSEAIVKIYPGAPHGFSLFPPNALKASAEGREDMKAFVLAKMP